MPLIRYAAMPLYFAARYVATPRRCSIDFRRRFIILPCGYYRDYCPLSLLIRCLMLFAAALILPRRYDALPRHDDYSHG